MIGFIYRLIFLLLPFIMGILLPYFMVVGQDRYINIFWSAVFGFGLYISYSVLYLSKEFSLLFGWLIWPICISVANFLFCNHIWETNNQKMIKVSLFLLIVSCFLVIDTERSSQIPYAYIPTFWGMLFGLY